MRYTTACGKCMVNTSVDNRSIPLRTGDIMQLSTLSNWCAYASSTGHLLQCLVTPVKEK